MGLVSNIARGAKKVKFKTVKHSPEILMIVGSISVIGGTVLACKKTLKCDNILESHKEALRKRDDIIEEYADEYTEIDRRKDTAVIYAQTAGRFVKTFALPTAMIFGGIGCMFLAKNITNKRYFAAMTALNGVSEAFNQYRERVRQALGEDVDRAMLTGGQLEKKASMVVVDEDGNESIVKKDSIIVDGERRDISIYARFFDPSCEQWEKNAEYNLNFLKGQERYANDVLKTRGHLFLNEVYDMIGFDHSQAGSLVGWIYDESNPDIDNYVDFGIYEMGSAANRNFVNGFEPVILLDFNVDGVIWDKI